MLWKRFKASRDAPQECHPERSEGAGIIRHDKPLSGQEVSAPSLRSGRHTVMAQDDTVGLIRPVSRTSTGMFSISDGID
jgi:hypothetical protein